MFHLNNEILSYYSLDSVFSKSDTRKEILCFPTSSYWLEVRLFLFQLRVSNPRRNFLFFNFELVTRGWNRMKYNERCLRKIYYSSSENLKSSTISSSSFEVLLICFFVTFIFLELPSDLSSLFCFRFLFFFLFFS